MLNNQPSLVQQCTEKIKMLAQKNVLVEVNALIQESISVTLNNGKCTISENNIKSYSLRCIKGNKESYQVYPSLSAIEGLFNEKYTIPYEHTLVENKKQIVCVNNNRTFEERKIELREKAEKILKEIKKLDEKINITDFQLTYLGKVICIANSCNSVKYLFSPEYIFEVETQKNLKDVTILGSSYIYEKDINDITIDRIIKDISFALPYSDFIKYESKMSNEDVVFARPIGASILENIVYYNLMNKPRVYESASVQITDDPLDKKSVQYCPFDDLGQSNTEKVLYSWKKSKNMGPVNSYYKIDQRHFTRDIITYPKMHPSNIIVSARKDNKKNILKHIERGIYCYLIVGNHNCSGDTIEGTVFNSFIIQDGKLHKPLLPFKIRFEKEDFLKGSILLGDDYEMVRPFPWWSPLVAKIPTMAVNKLNIQKS